MAPGAVAGLRAGIYHCVSRVVDRQFVLGKKEKEQFVSLMRLYEEFCGVRVLTFCVMSNHFHLLLEVPQRPVDGIPDRELLRRIRLLYGELQEEAVRKLLRQRKRAGDLEGAESIREKYRYRMWDLSQFMKALKGRFTQWFNKRHGRRGTLWEDRFKSVIVQDGYAARVMAAYIDLNPVRARIVEKPENYRWCGYAEALAGKTTARSGIARVMSEFKEWARGGHEATTGRRSETETGTATATESANWEALPQINWRTVIADYRVILLTDGKERLRENEHGQVVEVARAGVSATTTLQVMRTAGKLTRYELLRHRVRHFVDGAAIGMQDFLDQVFEEDRGRFGPKRKNGGRRMRSCDTLLRSMRDLRDGIEPSS